MTQPAHPIRDRSRDRIAALALATLLGGALTAAGCGRPPDQAGGTPPADRAPSVDAPRPLTPDEKLAEDVRHAMLQAPALAREDIQIATAQGLVVLAGSVSAPHLRDEAVLVAGSVPGVKSVQSKLVVKRR
ncbi:MAG TPA: BON domain-containing protein [Gemmatimonadota bacterium]